MQILSELNSEENSEIAEVIAKNGGPLFSET